MSNTSFVRSIAGIIGLSILSLTCGGASAYADEMVSDTASSTTLTSQDASSSPMAVSATTITGVAISSNNSHTGFAKNADTVTLTIQTSNGNMVPTAMIAGHSVSVSSTGTNTYTASYTLQSSDAEGMIPFSVSVVGQTVTSSTDSSSVTFDRVNPTGMFSSPTPMTTGSNPIPFTVSFSEPVMNLMSSFFNVGNGSITNFMSVSPTSYSFNVVPGAPSGSVSVDLNGDRVTDAAGNTNIALPQIQRIFDSSLPNTYVGGSNGGSGNGTTTGTGSGTGTSTDTVAPTLSAGSMIGTSTSATPSFTFTTSEAGTITYGGSCSSTTTTAVAGQNTVTFNTLANGTYSDCTLTVTDAAGNKSQTLAIASFTVDAPATTVSNGGGSSASSSDDDYDGVTHFSGSGGGYVGGGSTSSSGGTSGTSGSGTTGGSTGTSGSGTTGTTGSVLGASTGPTSLSSVNQQVTTSSSDLYPTTTDSSTTGTNGAAAAGLASVPNSIWALLVVIVLAILGGTWYYRRNTSY